MSVTKNTQLEDLMFLSQITLTWRRLSHLEQALWRSTCSSFPDLDLTTDYDMGDGGHVFRTC